MRRQTTYVRTAPAGRRGRPGARGMTLVELMFTIFIASALLVLAIPAFKNVFVGPKVSTISSDLMGSVQLARSEAIKRNIPITLCRANADADDCDTDTDWDGGWLVIDTATGLVIQHVEAQDEKYKVAQSAAADLVFQPIGVGATTSTFTVCRADPVGTDQRELNVTATGSAYVTAKESSTCP